MRVMAFPDSADAIVAQAQRCTRRLQWKDIAIGERLHAVEQYAPKGHTRSLAIIEVTNREGEPLQEILRSLDYGYSQMEEMAYAGLPHQYLDDFCKRHHCRRTAQVTVIQFKYIFPVPINSPAAKEMRPSTLNLARSLQWPNVVPKMLAALTQGRGLLQPP